MKAKRLSKVRFSGMAVIYLPRNLENVITSAYIRSVARFELDRIIREFFEEVPPNKRAFLQRVLEEGGHHAVLAFLPRWAPKLIKKERAEVIKNWRELKSAEKKGFGVYMGSTYNLELNILSMVLHVPVNALIYTWLKKWLQEEKGEKAAVAESQQAQPR